MNFQSTYARFGEIGTKENPALALNFNAAYKEIRNKCRKLRIPAALTAHAGNGCPAKDWALVLHGDLTASGTLRMPTTQTNLRYDCTTGAERRPCRQPLGGGNDCCPTILTILLQHHLLYFWQRCHVRTEIHKEVHPKY